MLYIFTLQDVYEFEIVLLYKTVQCSIHHPLLEGKSLNKAASFELKMLLL